MCAGRTTALGTLPHICEGSSEKRLHRHGLFLSGHKGGDWSLLLTLEGTQQRLSGGPDPHRAPVQCEALVYVFTKQGVVKPHREA